MRIYGIAGYPLGHSLSPLLHNRALQQAGIEGVYTAWPVNTDRLAAFVAAVRTLRIQGASLTIPLKEAVIPLLDGLTERARAVGAVNTLFWEGTQLLGDNTDVEGFMSSLRERSFSGALLLGAGGVARAGLAGLVELGIPCVVSSRKGERAKMLAGEFDGRWVPWEERIRQEADLIINATPLGMNGAYEDQSPLPSFAGRTGFTAYDLVYAPLMTRFLTEARAAGGEILDGLGMFVAQARAQFKLWTDREFSEDWARELLLAQRCAKEQG